MAKKTKPRDFEINRNIASYPPRKPSDIDVLDGQLHDKSQHRKKIVKRSLISIFLLVFVLAVSLATWDLLNISHASGRIFGSGNLLDLLNTSNLSSDASGRTNVLIVGYSVDDPGHPGANLTDSILVLSMNKQTKKGYLLSIPRDLYINIPGFGHAKINEAYQDGKSSKFRQPGYPDGGLGLLEKIMEQDFNIPIHYFVLENYGAVRDTVNALGGIALNIKSPDPRGLFDPNINKHDHGPLKLSNGLQELDGQTALNLTRARGDAPNAYGFPRADFDRTQHQRQVFAAIKQKIDWKLVLNPLKNGGLFNAIGDNIKTDLKASEAWPFFSLFKSIPDAELKSASLNNLNGKNLLTSYQTLSGQSALIPAAGLDNYSQITAGIQKLAN